MKKLLTLIIITLFLIACTPQTSKTNDEQSKNEQTTDSTNTTNQNNLITITSPQPNQEVSSPIKITGKAKGPWFFEASFPVILTNWDGLIISETFATAKTDWMTNDFVEFEASLSYTSNDTNKKATLIFKKDNPSGLPENDDALEIPIIL